MSSTHSAEIGEILRAELPGLIELVAQHVKAAPRLDRIAYTRQQAAEATGYGYDTISAAVRAGDLPEVFPEINGRRLARGVILRADLERWLEEYR